MKIGMPGSENGRAPQIDPFTHHAQLCDAFGVNQIDVLQRGQDNLNETYKPLDQKVREAFVGK